MRHRCDLCAGPSAGPLLPLQRPCSNISTNSSELASHGRASAHQRGTHSKARRERTRPGSADAQTGAMHMPVIWSMCGRLCNLSASGLVLARSSKPGSRRLHFVNKPLMSMCWPQGTSSRNHSNTAAAMPAREQGQPLQIGVIPAAAQLQSTPPPSQSESAAPASASQPAQDTPAIASSQRQAVAAGGYSTGVTTQPSGQGFKKTFYKRKLPSPPSVAFASREGMRRSTKSAHTQRGSGTQYITM